MPRFKKAIYAPGLYDGANRAYSDSNPPETLMMTVIDFSNIATPGANLTTLMTNSGAALYTKAQDGIIRPVDMSWENIPFTQAGTLSVKTGTSRFPIKTGHPGGGIGGAFQIQTIAVMCNTAPTGASIIVDVNKNGTTIFGGQSARPTIAAGTTSAVVGNWTVTSLTDGDYLTVDIDQVGSTVAGADLVVAIRIQRIL